MARHVGIVACSAEGAALCYRTLCAEGAALMGPHGHPEVSMHTPPLADYVRCLEAGDLDGVAALMLASANKLAAIGAEFLICPDNTIHQALPRVLPNSPRPWLHIAEVVAEAAQARGFRRLGLTGTRWLVDSEVYPQALAARGLAAVRPASVAALQQVIERLKRQGCDAVVLGCTELPLVLGDDNAELSTLDSTRLLARAALRHALA